MKSLILFLIGCALFMQDLFEKFGAFINVLFIGFMYILKTLPLALAGGFADYLITMKDKNEEFSFKKAMLNTFIAGFAGFLTIQLCNYYKVDPNMMGFLCGISGFAGVRALRFFESMTKKIIENIAHLKVVMTMDNKDKDSVELKEEKKIEVENEKEGDEGTS